MLKSRKIPYKVEGLDVIVRGLPSDLEEYFKDSIPDFTPVLIEEEPKALLDKISYKDAAVIGIALGLIAGLLKKGRSDSEITRALGKKTGMPEDAISRLIDEQKRKMRR